MFPASLMNKRPLAAQSIETRLPSRVSAMPQRSPRERRSRPKLSETPSFRKRTASRDGTAEPEHGYRFSSTGNGFRTEKSVTVMKQPMWHPPRNRAQKVLNTVKTEPTEKPPKSGRLLSRLSSLQCHSLCSRPLGATGSPSRCSPF